MLKHVTHIVEKQNFVKQLSREVSRNRSNVFHLNLIWELKYVIGIYPIDSPICGIESVRIGHNREGQVSRQIDSLLLSSCLLHSNLYLLIKYILNLQKLFFNSTYFNLVELFGSLFRWCRLLPVKMFYEL